jgi:predicted nucleic acid-binding protein
VQDGGERPGAREVAGVEWVMVQRVRAGAIVHLLRPELDEGEAEAIALAQEVGAALVLLDERDVRRVAGRMGLEVR